MALRDLPDTLPGALREFARHGSARLLVLLFSGLLAVRIAAGDASPWALAVAATVALLWPLQEWLLHVFVLHHEPKQVAGRTLDFQVARMHRAHHRDPWHVDLVFIPLRVFLVVPIVLVAILVASWEAPGRALTGLVVYFALALHYEWVHFLVHTRYRPRGRLYRRLWRNHRLHHFKNERYWMGVTMLSGDRLLGTAADPARVPTSATARTLGIEAT
jgi:hypothetical protein